MCNGGMTGSEMERAMTESTTGGNRVVAGVRTSSARSIINNRILILNYGKLTINNGTSMLVLFIVGHLKFHIEIGPFSYIRVISACVPYPLGGGGEVW